MLRCLPWTPAVARVDDAVVDQPQVSAFLGVEQSVCGRRWRLREGYGPNAPALLRLKEEGAAIVVTVDCGATAHEPLAAAAEAGLDVIVVDHHVSEPLLPRALALINPNRLDDDSPHGALAAVGVAFLLVVALNRKLREAGWYERRAEPDLLQWLDLVALGTVCDVVPLIGINRALVAQGIKVARRGENPGL